MQAAVPSTSAASSDCEDWFEEGEELPHLDVPSEPILDTDLNDASDSTATSSRLHSHTASGFKPSTRPNATPFSFDEGQFSSKVTKVLHELIGNKSSADQFFSQLNSQPSHSHVDICKATNVVLQYPGIAKLATDFGLPSVSTM